MIYVDVTGACLLPLQSGIPRTTRCVYRLLAGHLPEKITPLFWQTLSLSLYPALRPRADSFARSLRWPDSGRNGCLAIPLSRFCGPVLPIYSARGRRSCPCLNGCNTAIPCCSRRYFRTNRLEYLERLIALPGIKIALFHDAIPLRDLNVRLGKKEASQNAPPSLETRCGHRGFPGLRQMICGRLWQENRVVGARLGDRHSLAGSLPDSAA